MKNVKCWTGLLAAVLLAMPGTMPSRAATETINGITWKYSVSGNAATITGGGPSSGALNFPATLGGCPVTSITGFFGGNDTITSLSIPNSVTNIGDSVFFDCYALTSLVIPDSVRNIGEMAFRGCYRVSTLKLGKNLETIGNQAFYGCRSLKNRDHPGQSQRTQ